MLCTTCAALVGDSITHQMTRASASHPAMDVAFNVASQGAQTACPYPARGPMLASTNLPPTAYAVKPPCRHEYAPVHHSVCPIGESSP
jgi:hypothetical protein